MKDKPQASGLSIACLSPMIMCPGDQLLQEIKCINKTGTLTSRSHKFLFDPKARFRQEPGMEDARLKQLQQGHPFS